MIWVDVIFLPVFCDFSQLIAMESYFLLLKSISFIKFLFEELFQKLFCKS